MNIFIVGSLLLCISIGQVWSVGESCTSKSQCAADECCQIVNIIVASKKRQAELMPVPVEGSKTGTCEKYKQEGAWCQSFDVLNGYCGCAEGLACKTERVQVATLQPLQALAGPASIRRKRDMMPGYESRCRVVNQ